MTDLRDAEICRLQEEVRCVRAEVETLRAAVDACADFGDKQCAEIEHQRVTIADTMSDLAKAEAEIERLTAALREIAAYPHSEGDGEIARRALEPKP